MDVFSRLGIPKDIFDAAPAPSASTSMRRFRRDYKPLFNAAADLEEDEMRHLIQPPNEEPH